MKKKHKINIIFVCLFIVFVCLIYFSIFSFEKPFKIYTDYFIKHFNSGTKINYLTYDKKTFSQKYFNTGYTNLKKLSDLVQNNYKPQKSYNGIFVNSFLIKNHHDNMEKLFVINKLTDFVYIIKKPLNQNINMDFIIYD